MILDANQLQSIKQRNDEELRAGARGTHGYPAHTISNLLQTVDALKKEKRKWKRLAQTRGKSLDEIAAIATNAANAAGSNGHHDQD